MLGVLIEIFCGNRVARGRGFPRERDVTLKNLMGAPANADVRAIAVDSLAAWWRSLLLPKWPVAVVAPALTHLISHHRGVGIETVPTSLRRRLLRGTNLRWRGAPQ
jgi:hypothetical protein